MSRFDQLYRKLLLTKFFTKGWGDSHNLKRIIQLKRSVTNRDECRHLVDENYEIHIQKDESAGKCRLLEGHFESPFNQHLPGIMPKEVINAKFQMILPKVWKGDLKPVVLQLAGTGDHFFWRRRMLIGRPLLEEAGVASIILENPFYGCRKPKEQLRSSLRNVSDLFVMGGALILESLALFNWCEREGYGPLGITGISMGGHMASISAANWHKPLSLIPCMSASTASCVFTQGVMSGAIPWNVLEQQYDKGDADLYELIQNIKPYDAANNSDAFRLGQEVSKKLSKNIDNIDEVLREQFDMNQNNSCDNLNQSNVGSMKTNSISSSKNLKSSASYSTLAPIQSTTNLLKKFYPKKSKKRRDQVAPEVVDFFRGLMDECTHVGNFSVPVDTSLIIAVLASYDAYVPKDGAPQFDELWPGCEIRYLNYGHIASFLFKQDIFRKAIIDSMQRQINKYHPDTAEAKIGLSGVQKRP